MSSANKPVNLGVVGLSAGGSWFSRGHIAYFDSPSASDYKIVALQNSSVDSAKKAIEKWNLPSSSTTSHDNITSLVSDPNVTAVAISVKVPDHASLIGPAIEAGKDVFVEWPLAANLTEAEALTSLAREKGVRTLVGLQARQQPAIRKAKEFVESGKLGQILGSTMNGCGLIFGPTVTQDHTYLLPFENGANLATIPFGHAMDALCYVLGELSDLQAVLQNNRPQLTLVDGNGKEVKKVDKTAHDYLAVIGHLQREGNGVVSVAYQGGMSQTGRNFYWEINGTKGSLVLESTMGHIQMFAPTLKFTVFNQDGPKWEEVPLEDAKEFSYATGLAWEAWRGRGEGSVTTFDDALVRHRMLDAMYRSNEKGTRESYL